MNISFKGFMENTVTFQCDESVKAGAPVSICQSGMVTACAEGDKICGVCLSVREGYAAVQLKGYVELPVSGQVATGYVSVVSAADGKVKVSDDGVQVLCVSTDTDTAGFIL